jgi:hypothetical protein
MASISEIRLGAEELAHKQRLNEALRGNAVADGLWHLGQAGLSSMYTAWRARVLRAAVFLVASLVWASAVALPTGFEPVFQP